MKKFIILLFIINFLVLPLYMVKVYSADIGYLSYIEIVMTTGKLMRDFTPEETKALRKKTEKVMAIGISVAVENAAVPASYISSILVSYENAGTTDIEFSKTIQVETNNKISFSSSASESKTISGEYKKIKGQIAKKIDLDYKQSYEKSVKEKKEVKIKVEANSKMILYLTGDLLVYNGVFSSYLCFVRTISSPYEFIVLTSQYERLEKAKINEDLVIWKNN